MDAQNKKQAKKSRNFKPFFLLIHFVLFISLSAFSQVDLNTILTEIPGLTSAQKTKISKIYSNADAKIKANPDAIQNIEDNREADIFSVLNKAQSFMYDRLVTSAGHRKVKSAKNDCDDQDGDGVCDHLDREPNTPAGCPVDTHGITRDTDGDGIPDCMDKQLITPTACQPVDINGIGKCDFSYEPTFTIGIDTTAGGYVFYITPDGKHGKVAEIKDQGTGNWYQAQDLINDPANHSPEGLKFTDWRMPTKFELAQLFSMRSSIDSALHNKTFWSATEADTSSGWAQDFSSGSQIEKSKKTIFYIRAVRSF